VVWPTMWALSGTLPLNAAFPCLARGLSRAWQPSEPASAAKSTAARARARQLSEALRSGVADILMVERASTTWHRYLFSVAPPSGLTVQHDAAQEAARVPHVVAQHLYRVQTARPSVVGIFDRVHALGLVHRVPG
jgi:hypothetical protein